MVDAKESAQILKCARIFWCKHDILRDKLSRIAIAIGKFEILINYISIYFLFLGVCAVHSGADPIEEKMQFAWPRAPKQ